MKVIDDMIRDAFVLGQREAADRLPEEARKIWYGGGPCLCGCGGEWVDGSVVNGCGRTVRK